MNKIGKWTGIALLGASVIAFDALALVVGFGAARELRASPEAHAVSVATRIVVRAVVRQVVGGTLRAADDFNWAGIRGAPDAVEAIAAGDPDAVVSVRCRDRAMICRVEQARVVDGARIRARVREVIARLAGKVQTI